MQCPECAQNLKHPTLFLTSITVRCLKCGTRVTIAPGFFRDKIIDWETPEERKLLVKTD